MGPAGPPGPAGPVGVFPSVSITTADSPFLVPSTPLFVFADTSTGAIEVDLPAAPALNDEVIVEDSGNAAFTNNLTVDGNGNTINGAATRVIMTNSGSLSLKFSGAEWRIF